jgi:hypothetical protein
VEKLDEIIFATAAKRDDAESACGNRIGALTRDWRGE